MGIRPLIAVLFVSGLLAGCASDGSIDPQKVVTGLKIAHGAMDLGAVAYKSLPDCSTTHSKLCSRPEVVAKLDPAVALADTAFTTAEDLIANHADQDSVNRAIQAAMGAIGNVNALLGK